MDPPVGATSQRRAFPRVPLRAKVRMEFSEQRCFLSEWAVNLSPGGMYVRSEAPIVAGQRFDFDAGLTPKGPRFGGVGEVLWVRKDWEGTARPPGFAVRFLELDDHGRLAIERLASLFLAQGVAAMQQELGTLAAEWQRRRLDDDRTDEIVATDSGELALPDTAVLRQPWLPLAEIDTAKMVRGDAPAEAAAGEEAAIAEGDTPPTPRLLPDPAVVQPPPAVRRRAWWAGALVLAVAASGYALWRGGATRSAPRLAATAAATRGRAVAAPAVAAAVPASDRRQADLTFGALQSVTWVAEGDGLWVVLALDGAVPEDAVRRFRLPEDPPREVVQLLGARRAFAPEVVAVHAPLLEQVRVGFHPGDAGELRVVLDLTSPAVVVRAMRIDGHSLRLLLARALDAPGPLPATSANAAPPAAAAPTSARAAGPMAPAHPAAARGPAKDKPAPAPDARPAPPPREPGPAPAATPVEAAAAPPPAVAASPADARATVAPAPSPPPPPPESAHPGQPALASTPTPPQ